MIPSRTRLLFITIGTIALVLSLAGMASAAGPGKASAVSIQGIVHVDGQDAVVEVLVAVLPGENGRDKARAVLNRAYPGAREISAAEFGTTGLVWDVFLDGDPSNDEVLVNYNPKDVPSNISGLDHRGVWSASQATWTSVSGSSFAFADGGDTGRCPSLVKECKGRQKFDGNNDVGWGNISDPSVLGVT